MKHKACVQGDLSQLHDCDVKILSMGITIYVVKAICHTCQSIISRNESEYFPRGMILDSRGQFVTEQSMKIRV